MAQADSSDQTPPAGKSAAEVSETDLILNLANPDAADAAPAKHVDPKWQQRYDDLLAFRDYLIDEISDHEVQGRLVEPGAVQESASQGDRSSMMRDYMLAMTSTEQDTLNEVNEAIGRIEEGTYGVCQLSGKPIPAERLEAVPWTRFSVEAQDKVEHHNQSPVHARLGTLPHQQTPPDVPVPGSDAEREVSEVPPEGTERYRPEDHK